MAQVTTKVSLVNVASAATIQLGVSALDYIRKQGGGGWGLAPRQNRWTEGARGTRFRSTRKGRRTYTIPLAIVGDGRQQIEDRLRALANVVSSPFRIVVTYSTGRTFSVAAYYESGLEGSFGGLVDRFNEADLVMSCPQPDWTSGDSQTATFVKVNGEPLFPNITFQHLTPNTSLGERTLSNAGDVEAPATWVLKGPIGGGSEFRNAAGEGFAIADDQTIDVGEVITIKNGRVTDATGANRYDLLDLAPYFFLIAKGSPKVTVAIVDADENTNVALIWPERREVVYG